MRRDRYRFLRSSRIALCFTAGLMLASTAAYAQQGAHGASDAGTLGGNGDSNGVGKPVATEAGGSSGSVIGDDASLRPMGASADRPNTGRQGLGQSDVDRFSDWLSSSGEGARLSGVARELRMLAMPALVAGVPFEVFVYRIKEAVAKRASPEVIIKALDADSASWEWLAGILEGGPWPPTKAEVTLYLAVAAALRNGLQPVSVHSFLVWCRDSGVDAGKVAAALTTVASITTALVPGDGIMAGDASAILVRSRLRASQYSAVAELAKRADDEGISSARFMAILESTIGSGLSITAFKKALFSR